MKRIVVGIDGSEQGWAALTQAAGLARATKAGLKIVYALTPVGATFSVPEVEYMVPSWLEAQQQVAKDLLREARARVADFAVEVEAVSPVGTPAETLAQLSEPAEVDMVVVGHRGRNLASRLLIGSVADRLVQISRKPVLVVH